MENTKNLSTNESKNVIAQVARAAGKIGGLEGVKILRNLDEDGNERVKENTARSIGAMEGGSAEIKVKMLKTLAEDGSESMKIGIAMVAGEMGGVEGVEILRSLADDDSEHVREQVIQSAKDMKRSEDAEALKSLITY